MLTVPLRSKRRKRALAVQKFQHVLPALPLLMAGAQALRSEPHGLALVLGIFEIATSTLLLWTVARELRSLRRPAHAEHASHGVDWFHLFASGVLMAEVLEHWHLTHHWRRPTLLTALLTLGLGLFHGRIEAWSHDRRALKIGDEGIRVGGRPFRTFQATWAEVQAVEVGERFASIRTRDGRERRIDLADCEQPAPVRAALLEAQGRLLAPPDYARP